MVFILVVLWVIFFHTIGRWQHGFSLRMLIFGISFSLSHQAFSLHFLKSFAWNGEEYQVVLYMNLGMGLGSSIEGMGVSVDNRKVVWCLRDLVWLFKCVEVWQWLCWETVRTTRHGWSSNEFHVNMIAPPISDVSLAVALDVDDQHHYQLRRLSAPFMQRNHGCCEGRSYSMSPRAWDCSWVVRKANRRMLALLLCW